MIAIVIISGVIVALVVFIWWLFIETEGIYLGKRVVIWLYDLYATRYDSIKGNDDVDEHVFLASPVIDQLRPHVNPLVLDVATGTGRMPLALCQHARFEGYIVAVDLSHNMLVQAAQKIADNHFDDYVTFIHANGDKLPFEANTFDLVTCMEALEFMPQPEKALQELTRVLRPSGTLLTTLRWNAKWMPSIWSENTMRQLLSDHNIEAIDIQQWQMDYKLVWGKKIGTSDFIGARPLEEFLRCPRCQKGFMVETDKNWVCENCHAQASVDKDGILALVDLQ